MATHTHHSGSAQVVPQPACRTKGNLLLRCVVVRLACRRDFGTAHTSERRHRGSLRLLTIAHVPGQGWPGCGDTLAMCFPVPQSWPQSAYLRRKSDQLYLKRAADVGCSLCAHVLQIHCRRHNFDVIERKLRALEKLRRMHHEHKRMHAWATIWPLTTIIAQPS